MNEMKKSGEEDDEGSRFKRPATPSRQINNPSGLTLVEDTSLQKLTASDALAYLKDVRDEFDDQMEKYDQLVGLLAEFKAKRIDASGIIARVKELFRGHPKLIQGFNTFLPKRSQITLPLEDDFLQKKKPVHEFDEATNFVDKVKTRFQDDDSVLKSFMNILISCQKGQKTSIEVYQEVASLFQGNDDLLEEFRHFFPADSSTESVQQTSGRSDCRQGGRRDLESGQTSLDTAAPSCSSQKRTIDEALAYLKDVRDEFHDKIEKYGELVELLAEFQSKRIDTPGLIARVKELFRGHPKLIPGFNIFLPESDQITVSLEDDEAVAFDESVKFLTKVHTRFQDDDNVFRSFIDILNMNWFEQKPDHEVYQVVSPLFEGHDDLLEELREYFQSENSSAKDSLQQTPVAGIDLECDRLLTLDLSPGWRSHSRRSSGRRGRAKMAATSKEEEEEED